MEKTLQGQYSYMSRLATLIEKDRNLHILFWFLLWIFLTVIDRSDSNFVVKTSKSTVSVIFYAFIVYFNWLVLIPNFLKKRNWIIYIALLMVLAGAVSPPKTLCFYLIYNNYPDIQQYFLANQNIILFESIFVCASSTAFKITQDWMLHERDKKDLQRQNLQSELNFLRSQINPHFLFNTLNNLYALTLKKSDLAPETVLKLSEMMRYMLYECNEIEVPLSKEIQYLKNYLELEKIRLGNQFEVNLEIEGEPGHLNIAPLMFVPFVENSFKHGVSNTLNDGFVNIRLKIEDPSVHMEISNSRPDQKLILSKKKSGGIGLVNIKRRLNLIYPENHSLDIRENNNNYAVSLSINLK